MEGGQMAGQTQVRSEGPKNVFETPPPPLLSAPLFSRSGSTTAVLEKETASS